MKNNKNNKILYPVSEPLLMGNEKKYVSDCLASNWISSSGKYISAFEDVFAAKVNRRFGCSVCNGMAALILALRALDLPPRSEVICPSFCMSAPVMAVIHSGLKPVFVDVDDTWNMDPEKISTLINSNTSAVMVVHNYGLMCDLDRIQMIARKNMLSIIEDAAEAHGATYKDRPAGSFGDVSCFLFYANKIITTGEGGMVVTDEPAIAERLAYFRNMCFSPNPEKRFLHKDVGFNFRMTNIQAAIGLAQMENFEHLVELRIQMAERYLENLADSRGILFRQSPEHCLNVYWMFGFLIDEVVYGCRDLLAERLETQGIETRRFFFGADEQPFIAEKKLIPANARFPFSNRLSRQGLYFPSSPTLEETDIRHICATLRKMER